MGSLKLESVKNTKCLECVEIYMVQNSIPSYVYDYIDLGVGRATASLLITWWEPRIVVTVMMLLIQLR